MFLAHLEVDFSMPHIQNEWCLQQCGLTSTYAVQPRAVTAAYVIVCLSHCSITVQRHHDQGNYYKRKYLIGALLTVSEG